MTPTQTIFLSSTSSDLHAYREQVHGIILRMGGLPILIDEEHYADDVFLQDRYDKIQEAHIFVGLYAHRYGSVPTSSMVYRKTDQTTATGDNQTSIIQWEYQWALERGLPMFLFMVQSDDDNNAPADWPPEHVEGEPGKTRLQSFKSTLIDKHGVGVFTSPDDLAQQVGASLTGLLTSQSSSAQRFKGYELQAVIGAGGYGMVYRAQQTAVDRQVAIKSILPEYTNQPDFIRSFEAEAQLIARLEHPYIVPLFDYWRDADSTCLVMRFMRGGSISQYIKGQPLPLKDVLRWMEHIGAALAFAHRHGVIHRDLKPDNLLLDEEGNAYLSDFGIARPTGSPSKERSITGTMAYIAPDQLKGEPPTPQADLYSFGIVLYELLTGIHPFAGQTPSQLVMSHLAIPLPDITHARPELSPLVQAAIERATAKDPGQRYSDAREMIDAFHQALSPVIRPLEIPAPDPTLMDIELTNPYKGLRAFQEYDEGDFFGREALVEQFIERMTQDEEGRLLVVVGPSGSGKSSVVKAGLLPALRRGALPGSEKWFITEMMPSSQPLEALEAALLRVAINPSSNLLDELKESEYGLAQVLKRILPSDETQLLLVIDQFEELFTLTNDEEQRVHFLTSLLMALKESQARLRVVLTLRADFYDKPLYYLDFGTRLRKSVETVLPLSPAELEQSIVRPAEQAGAVLENGLVAAVLQEIGEQPGILPLLQYALTELFEQRQGLLLTFKAYHAMGGVTGALGQRAEALYADLDQTGQEAVRQIFLRLMTLGDGTEDTRRRVRQSEFVPSALPVIQRFGEARLLTFDRDPQTRGPTVEVAHEALLRTWQRLKDWIAAVRDELSIHRRLSHAAEEWLRASQDTGFLVREAPLEQFESWSQTTTLNLNEMEQAFLDASLAEREQRHTFEIARKAHEAKMARRAQNLGRAAAVFAVTGVLAIVLTVIAFVRSSELEETAAIVAAQIINANATLDVQGTSAAVANIALTAQESSVQNVNATLDAQGTSAAVANIALTAQESSVQNVNATLDAQGTSAVRANIALTAQEEAVRKANAEGTQVALEVTAIKQDGEEQEERLVSLSLVDDARRALAVGDRPLAMHLALLAASRPGMKYPPDLIVEQVFHEVVYSLGQRKTLARTDSNIGFTAFSQEKGLIALGLQDGTIEVRDAITGRLIIATPLPGLTPRAVTALAFNKAGTKLVYGLNNRTLWILDLESAAPATKLPSVSPAYNTSALVFSPDEQYLAAGGDDAKVHLLDARSGIELSAMRAVDPNDSTKGQTSILALAFTPDGTRLLAGGEGEEYALSVWHLSAQGQTTLVHDGFWRASEVIHAVTSIAVYSDSGGTTKIAIGSNDHLGVFIRLWDLATGVAGSPGPGHTTVIYSLAFSREGRYLVSGSFDMSVRLWDVTTNVPQAIGMPLVGHTSSVRGVAFNADDQSVVSASLDRTVRLWDVTIPQLEGAPWPGTTGSNLWSVAISPDGKYVAAGANDGIVRVWDASSRQLLTETYVRSSVNTIAFSPLVAQQDYHPTIAMGLNNGQVHLWNVNTPDSSPTAIVSEKEPIFQVAYSSDGRYIAIGSGHLTGSGDSHVQIWDVMNAKILHYWTVESAARSVAISPPGVCPGGATCVAAGLQSGALRLWDFTSGQLLSPPTTRHADAILSLAFSPTGKCGVPVVQPGTCLVTGSADRTINMWTLSGNLIGAAWIGHGNWVNSVAFSPDGRYVITGSADKTLRLWDAATHTPLGEPWAAHTDFVNAIAFMPDGQHLVSVSIDGTLRTWSVRTMLQMIAWACENRYARPLSAAELAAYGVEEDISSSTCPAIQAGE